MSLLSEIKETFDLYGGKDDLVFVIQKMDRDPNYWQTVALAGNGNEILELWNNHLCQQEVYRIFGLVPVYEIPTPEVLFVSNNKYVIEAVQNGIDRNKEAWRDFLV